MAKTSQNSMKEFSCTLGDCRVSSTINFIGRNLHSSLEVICDFDLFQEFKNQKKWKQNITAMEKEIGLKPDEIGR